MKNLLGAIAVVAACGGWGQADAADLALTTVDAPPWAGSNEAGPPSGAFVDLVGELQIRTGHRVTVTLHPFARVVRDLEYGEQDCAILLWDDDRGRVALRGEQVYPMTFGVVARRDVVLSTYEDLVPLAISVTRNLKVDPRFDGDDRLRKDLDKDYRTGLGKLERGRVDAVAGALPTILAQAERYGFAPILGEPLVLSVIPLVLQCSRQSQNVGHMASLDEAIRDMREDGSLARLLARHGYP